ncbi:hypothetical protein [Nocardioides euryhalodurans]|nr:hypothetical protein [Nocardioides euryhalodurans]
MGRGRPVRVAGAQLMVCAGAPHGVTVTHEDRPNNDLLEFLKS